MKRFKLFFFLLCITLTITTCKKKEDDEQLVASCTDGIQNQEETGVDCGGPCAACNTGGQSSTATEGYVSVFPRDYFLMKVSGPYTNMYGKAYNPDGSTDYVNTTFTYTSSDNSIATVSANGDITPLRPGIAFIEVKNAVRGSAFACIEVIEDSIAFPDACFMSFDPAVLTVGLNDTVHFNAAVSSVWATGPIPPTSFVVQNYATGITLMQTQFIVGNAPGMYTVKAVSGTDTLMGEMKVLVSNAPDSSVTEPQWILHGFANVYSPRLFNRVNITSEEVKIRIYYVRSGTIGFKIIQDRPQDIIYSDGIASYQNGRITSLLPGHAYGKLKYDGSFGLNEYYIGSSIRPDLFGSWSFTGPNGSGCTFIGAPSLEGSIIYRLAEVLPGLFYTDHAEGTIHMPDGSSCYKGFKSQTAYFPVGPYQQGDPVFGVTLCDNTHINLLYEDEDTYTSSEGYTFTRSASPCSITQPCIGAIHLTNQNFTNMNGIAQMGLIDLQTNFSDSCPAIFSDFIFCSSCPEYILTSRQVDLIINGVLVKTFNGNVTHNGTWSSINTAGYVNLTNIPNRNVANVELRYITVGSNLTYFTPPVPGISFWCD